MNETTRNGPTPEHQSRRARVADVVAVNDEPIDGAALARELQRRIDEPVSLGRVLQTDPAFRQAALHHDRDALRKAVAQKASELGVTLDALVQDYTLLVVGDLVSRLELEFDEEREGPQLARMPEAFRLELALNCARLELYDVM